jgi:hypothetical protein
VASLGLLVRQMEIWYQCYTQHRLNFIFPSGSFSLAKASIRHRLCHSLKRNGFADFNAKANGK